MMIPRNLPPGVGLRGGDPTRGGGQIPNTRPWPAPRPAQPGQQPPDPADAQSISPMRQRLAEALLKATTPPEGEDVQHPMQALGNAANQMANAYLQRKMGPGGLPPQMRQPQTSRRPFKF